MFPRSSNRRTEAYLTNSVGIADTALYRGEIVFCYKNRESIESLAVVKRTSEFFRLLENGFALVDAAHLSMKIYNDTVSNPMLYAPYQVGERIGQMVFLAHTNVRLNEVEELSETERGEGGFGSTRKIVS